MKKVAFITSSIDPTKPVEGFIYDWVNSLSKNVDLLIVITFYETKLEIIKKLPPNIKVYSLVNKTKLQKFLHLFEILKNENKEEPLSGIINHMYDFIGVSGGIIAKLLKIKSLYWYAGGIKFNLFSLVSLSMWLNTKVITCSESEKKRYSEISRIPILKIQSIGHGINPLRFQIDNSKNLKTNNSFKIGYIARTTPEKNILELISALNKLDYKVELHLALTRFMENPEYANKINTAIKKCKYKVYISHNIPFDKLNRWFKNIDLYIHPSSMKSVDKAGIEAIFSGKDVLLSKCGYTQISEKFPQLTFDPRDDDFLIQSFSNYLTIKKSNKYPKSELYNFCIKHYGLEEFMKRFIKEI